VCVVHVIKMRFSQLFAFFFLDLKIEKYICNYIRKEKTLSEPTKINAKTFFNHQYSSFKNVAVWIRFSFLQNVLIGFLLVRRLVAVHWRMRAAAALAVLAVGS